MTMLILATTAAPAASDAPLSSWTGAIIRKPLAVTSRTIRKAMAKIMMNFQELLFLS
jgi:hypothetical protein